MAFRASVCRTRQIGSPSLCLPLMLAHSDALRGMFGKRQEWWIHGGTYKRPNVHLQRHNSACGVRHHRYGRSR